MAEEAGVGAESEEQVVARLGVAAARMAEGDPPAPVQAAPLAEVDLASPLAPLVAQVLEHGEPLSQVLQKVVDLARAWVNEQVNRG